MLHTMRVMLPDAVSLASAQRATVTVIRVGQGGAVQLETMTWGLIPAFHKPGDKLVSLNLGHPPRLHPLPRALCRSLLTFHSSHSLLSHSRCSAVTPFCLHMFRTTSEMLVLTFAKPIGPLTPAVSVLLLLPLTPYRLKTVGAEQYWRSVLPNLHAAASAPLQSVSVSSAKFSVSSPLLSCCACLEPLQDHWRMFNARSEGVDTSPVFRRLMATKRCLIVLNGFYEWKAGAGGRKQPYYV